MFGKNNKKPNNDKLLTKELKQEKAKLSKKERKILKQNRDKIQNLFKVNNIYSDGTVEIPIPGDKRNKRFARIVHFSDVNYQLATQDEQINIFYKYSELITYFDPSVDVQMLIVSREVSLSDVKNKVAFKMQGDKYDKLRREYNESVLSNIFQNKQTFRRGKYMVFSVPADKKETASALLDRLSMEVLTRLRNIGCSAEILSTDKEVMELFRDIVMGDKVPVVKDTDEGYGGLITGSGLDYDFRDYFSPAGIINKPTYLTILKDNGDELYTTYLTVKQYPPRLMDSFIGEISLTQFNTVISLQFKSISQDRAVNMVTNKLSSIEMSAYKQQASAAKEGVAYLPPKLRLLQEDMRDLLQSLEKEGQRLFETALVISVTGNSLQEMKDNVNLILSIARKNNVDLTVIPVEKGTMISAFNTVLPTASTYVNVRRIMSTAGTAILIPFTSKDILDMNGIYYGINKITNSPIIFDRLSLKNPNGFILGIPGGGKSFAAKREILSVFLRKNLHDLKDDIIIIDPEREYVNLTKALGGAVLRIDPGSKTYINPLDINDMYSGAEENPVAFKSSFLMSLISMMMFSGQEQESITSIERSVIDKTVKSIYADYYVRMKGDKKTPQPTLLDLYKKLKYSGDSVAMSIAKSIEIYVTGSYNIFAHNTNIHAESPIIDFDLRDLTGDLKSIGMFIVLDSIWNRISRNRELKRRTWVYIDEIYLLFSSKYALQYLSVLFKRARKWGAVLTGITQNVEDVLKDLDSRKILSNTEFMLLFSQSQTDIEMLEEVLKITPKDANFIIGSPPGQGLIKIENSYIPVYDNFPKDTELYKIMTTKFGEA